MKKVLIIQQIIPEYRIAFFSQLRTELAKEDIELNVIYSNKSNSYKSGSRFYELDWGRLIVNKTIKIGRIELCWQPLTKYLKGNDLVIVEKSNKLLLNYYLIAGRKFLKIKLGFWGHGRNIQADPDSIANKFAYVTLRMCDWWWAYTNSVRDFLVSKKFPLNKITVVQNAIDTVNLNNQIAEVTDRELLEVKNALGIKGQKITIFCGGMYPDKRIDFILEACSGIKKSIPDFEIIFIGAGVDAHKVADAAEKHSWIHYVGTQNGKDRIKYFKIASVQLMPGLVGLGILDSFALQTPIITTNFAYHSPEVEYLENGKNGIITENNLDAYTKGVVNILKSDKYLDLLPGCIQSAQEYTIEKMVDNFKNGIISCLDQT